MKRAQPDKDDAVPMPVPMISKSESTDTDKNSKKSKIIQGPSLFPTKNDDAAPMPMVSRDVNSDKNSIKKSKIIQGPSLFPTKNDDVAPVPLKSSEKLDIQSVNTSKTDTKLTISPTTTNKRKFGPSLEDLLSPVTEETNKEEEVIVGPVLPGVSRKIHVEEKDNEAEKWQKIKETGTLQTNTNKPKRDDWISVPPPTRTGIVARTHFSKKDQSGLADQSVWVDTPAEKEAKAAGKKGDNSEKELANKRAKEMDGMISKYNEKKRPKTLLDVNKDVKSSVATVELPKSDYEPFDREKVLGITKKVNDKKRNELINEAKKFNSNFERGSYLS